MCLVPAEICYLPAQCWCWCISHEGVFLWRWVFINDVCAPESSLPQGHQWYSWNSLEREAWWLKTQTHKHAGTWPPPPQFKTHLFLLFLPFSKWIKNVQYIIVSIIVARSSLFVYLQQLTVFITVRMFSHLCVPDCPANSITFVCVCVWERIKRQLICWSLFPLRHLASKLNAHRRKPSQLLCTVNCMWALVWSVCPECVCLLVCRNGSRVWGRWFTTSRPTTSVRWPASRNSKCTPLLPRFSALKQMYVI